jgi:TolB-like protein/Flp pilus assembly protein TadD
VSFLGELKRRNVIRVGIAYGLGAWVLLQAADFGLQVIDAPNWILQVLVLIAAIGLPAVLVFAGIFEMTPEGLKRESDITPEQSISAHTGRKLDRTIIAILVAAVALLLLDRFSHPQITPESAPEAAQSALPGSAEPDIAENGKPSIAVLPFVNMSSDPEQEYFSDGLAEELLNRLVKFDQLQVAARTSSFQFKGQNLDMAEIGRQLKVEHLLEGSVRKAGNRLRVTAQLIKANDGYHLWSETYEREIDDIFGIQDEISDAITNALKLELGVHEAKGRPTENIEAYQLFLQARHALAKRGADNMHDAITLFEQAIELDPTFARAYSGAAITWSLLPGYGGATEMEARQRANELATKARQLDPDNPESYVALGRMRGNAQGAIVTAQQNFEKAYQLAPNDVDVVNLYGDFLFNMGRIEEAEAMERRAMELDPLAAVHYSDLAFVLLAQGKDEEALDLARTSARLAPDIVDRQDALLYTLARNGEFEEATQLINYAVENLRGTDKYVNSWRCLVAFEQGNLSGLRQLVQERVAESHEVNFNTYSIAAWYTLWLDGSQAALPLLEKSLEAQEYMLTWPEFFFLPELISDDPDFLAFWERPELRGLMETRRANWDGRPMGYWRERPQQ